jgi:PAS domain S-box-containing protein
MNSTRSDPDDLTAQEGNESQPDSMLDLKDRALDVAAEGITIADARLPDMPLIYINEGFERLTGYSAEATLGHNCRFLQGPDTDPEAVEEIRTAIREQRPCLVEILNYRRDGTTFWNRLSITPVRDSAGTVTHFIGIQSDVTKRRRAEDELAEANRHMREDLDAAASVQQSLLPDRAPDLPGLEVAWTFRPCTELAGDTFNILPLGDGSFGFYIIDVSGHGVPAALLSVTLSHTLSPVSGRSWLLGSKGSHDPNPAATPPPEVVTRLNGFFQMQADSRQYFTMIYGIFEPSNRRLRYASAGHPPIVLEILAPSRWEGYRQGCSRRLRGTRSQWISRSEIGCISTPTESSRPPAKNMASSKSTASSVSSATTASCPSRKASMRSAPGLNRGAGKTSLGTTSQSWLWKSRPERRTLGFL